MSERKMYQKMQLRHAVGLAAPHSFAASLCPAIFGLLYAKLRYGTSISWKWLTLPAACVLLQSAVNTLNDYMDFKKGTDSKSDSLEESDAVLLYGGIDPASAKKLGMIYLFSGVLLGLVSAFPSPLPAILIGLLGVAVILMYSGGPCPISYLPAGEAVSGFVMGGLIPMGVTAALLASIHAETLFYAVPLMLGIALIMLCNNGSDLEKDREAGRRTLPVLLGRERIPALYQTGCILWLLSIPLFAVTLTGYFGLLSVLFLLLVKDAILAIFRNLPDREGRILAMQSISRADFLVNGAYLLTILCYLMRRAFCG